MKDNSIFLIVLGGLGGMQSGPNMLTELQQAHKPNLNALVRKSLSGLMHIIAPGIVPSYQNGLSFLLGLDQKGTSLFVKNNLKTLLITDNAYHKGLSSFGIEIEFYSKDLATGITILEKKCENYDFICFYSSCLEQSARRKEYYEKVKAIEHFDSYIETILKLSPKVLAITGDCSLPTVLGVESWHPVPLLLYSQPCRYDYVQTFDEISCTHGGLGIIQASALVPILLADAGRSLPQTLSD